MYRIKFIALCSLLTFSSIVLGQDEETGNSDNLEQKIQNPVADLISLPFQNNIDFGVGPDNRTRNTLNIQPVLPFKINENFNLITRTIVPVISQPVGSSNSEFGLGDVNLSLFLTSAKPKKTIIGYGLALGLPTATDPVLGTGKWSAGPSVVVLVQPKGLTVGGLVQNTWSYAGASDRPDVNFFYSQVFVVKNLSNGWYVNSAPIITANWEASSGNQWTVPIGAGAGKLFRAGKLPINAQLGYYYNVVTPDFGPESQLRIQVVLLFPK
ncbi:neuromedin U [Aureitalea marina]|uniref:neuromedin U n=1 Tax=Aureitalea marina TaxID=930804 RepID=UPI0011B0785A|nr:neuromedin U [Aureitalea marina]